MTYAKIKRRNGEAFAKTIKNYDNGIFDIANIDKIVRYAGGTAQDAEALLPYLISLKNIVIEEKPAPQCPFKLLKQAGYDAFYADTEELKNSIKHLYYDGEAICTFNDDSRHKNYHIVHCVHERAAKLNRNDYKTPRREDDYGTSVISIQMAKKGGFISIKNRYNHKVNNCDNTFSSNPDNIIDGLAAALKAHFKVDFSSQKTALPDNFILCGIHVCKVDYEINGVNYGYDYYVQNGEVIEVKAGDGQYLMETFIYCDKTKMMRKLSDDTFPDDFNRDYGGRKSLNMRKDGLYDGDKRIIKCV